MSKVKPSKEEMEEFYMTKKLSTKEISKIIGVTKTTVRDWLKKYKITIRNSKNYNWEVMEINPPRKEELEKDYKTLSLELIAKKYGTSTEPILLLLQKYGIQKRTRGESKRLAEKTGRFVPWNKGKSIDNPEVAEVMQNLHLKQMEKIKETSKKISETRKKLFSEGKLKSWMKGKTHSKETKDKLRLARLRQKVIQKNTKPERLMKLLLENNNLTEGLKEQFSLKIGQFVTIPDFAYPKYKVAIYCDGEFWHGGFQHINQSFNKMKEGKVKEGIKKTIKKDEQIHYVLWENGWVPLRFWQHDIEENPKWVIELIKKNIFNKK